MRLSINLPRDIVPRWLSSLAQVSGCMETERVTAVLPLAFLPFAPFGRPAPGRRPPLLDFAGVVIFRFFAILAGGAILCARLDWQRAEFEKARNLRAVCFLGGLKQKYLFQF